MKHHSEDELLASALETLETGPEREAVAAHLEECADCRARLARIHRDVAVIGSLAPRVSGLQRMPPRRRSILVFSMLKAAALMVLGFCIGLGVSTGARREPACIMPAYLDSSPPADASMSGAVSDATDAGMQIDRR